MALLRTRWFLPLFLAQALGALNDNLYKSAVVVLVAFQDPDGGGAIVAIAGGLFILPYLLFSSLAGELADRFDKARLIRLMKLAELALMLAAGAALLAGAVGPMLAVLFGLGVQAAFFGPLKYGILPERLEASELLRGNALVEAGTFAAILLGTIAGAALINLPGGRAVVAGTGLAIAAAGLFAALALRPGEAAAPALRLDRNPVLATMRLLAASRRNRAVWVALLGLSWFWALGATFLAQFPVLAKTSFGAESPLVSMLLASFTAGIGLGSLLAGRLARDPASLVPAAAAVLSLCTFGFALLASSPQAAAWHSPAAMLAAPSGVAALLCLLGAAGCGGLYSVPLYAMLQRWAPSAERARVIAANNVMNALFMVGGAVVLAGLASAGFRPTAILAVAGALNAGAALLMRRALRSDMVAARVALRHESP